MARIVLGPPIPQEEQEQPKITLGAPIQQEQVVIATPPTAEDEGTFQEIGEGIASGLIAIPQGVAELVAGGIDLMADTDYSTDVTEGAQYLRDQLGLDPTGTAGTIAEVVTQFVVPGLGAASAVSKASKLGKLAASGQQLSSGQKFALGAQQVAAAAGADIMVATDGTTTIGDFFDGGPTTTDDTVGLRGREEALRRLTNKLKVGTETGAIVSAAPGVLGLAGSAIAKTGDVASTAVSPVLSPVVRGIRESKVVKGTKELLDEIEMTRILEPELQSPLRNAVADTLSIFRYRGFLPSEVGRQRSLISGIGEGELKVAQNTLNEMNTIIDDITKGNSELTRDQILNNLNDFLDPRSVGAKNPDARRALLDNLPTELQPVAVKMRTHIDDLSRDVLNSDLIAKMKEITPKKNAKATSGEVLEKTIQRNMGSYLRRRFLAKMDPNYRPDPAALKAGVEGFKADAKGTLTYLKKLHRQDPDDFTLTRLGLTDDGERLIGNTVTDAQAELAAKKFLQEAKVTGGKGAQEAARQPIERIRAGMFIDKRQMPDYQRRLLGEIRDPQESYLATVADLAEFKANDAFFGRIRQLADNNEGIGRLFIKPENAARAPVEYRTLGSEALLATTGKGLSKINYGSLEGYLVPETIYKQLTRAVTQDHGPMARALMGAYSGFLRAKGFTQYGKTVLSPITQIRNVTSASMFAMAQGNVGAGANLFESVRLVLDDIKKLTPDAQLKELQDLQSMGVIGTQAELQEIRRLINQGTAVNTKTTEAGRGVGSTVGRWISTSKGGEFYASAGKKIAGVSQKMEDLYQGGDDIWKIYNYKFERSKLQNALRNMGDDLADQYVKSKGYNSTEEFLRREAADVVRNNVPNYNLAPEFIKTLRVLPFGNFIAFPFEIIRTGANTIARSLDEMASTNKEIQKIGTRRLFGATTTFALMPAGLSELAHNLSGVSKEEMDAYQRSVAAPWEKNARLLPTGRDENGLPTYINYSYTNPYDMLERFANGAFNKFEESKSLGQDTSTATAKAGWEALTELVSPFTEESIAFAALRDVLPVEAGGRGGETVTGARIYNPEESIGDQIAKGFTHVLGTVLPLAATPFDVRGGEVEVGRFTRSLISATGMNDVLGVSEMDKQKRERQFAGELVRALTGVTESTINADMALKFKGYEFSEARTDASNIFNRIARRPNLMSETELLDAYDRANEARFQAFNRFHQVVEDMRTMGLSDYEIKKTLKGAGVSGINKLMRGQYEPLEISDPVKKEMRRNGTEQLLPRLDILYRQMEQRQREFGEPEPAPAPAQETPDVTLGEPVTTGQPAPRITLGAPITTGPSQNSNQVSPILVPNPSTQATFGIK